MKYTITINQLGLYYAGLNFKTDWNDWAIIDYLKDFALHRKSKRIIYKNEEYVWLNYNHLIANLPFCKFQGKWTVSRRIAELRFLGLIKTYRAKDNTLYVAFTDKLIDICWAKRTDIEKMRRIAGIPQNKEVIHNSLTPVAVNSNRGYCTNNATAQIVTKYPIETNNNKDISFSSSLKPKAEKPQIHPAPIYTDLKRNDSSVKYDKSPHENRCGASTDNNKNPSNPIRKEVKGFKTMSGIWQVLENIKHRGLANANSKSKIPSSK